MTKGRPWSGIRAEEKRLFGRPLKTPALRLLMRMNRAVVERPCRGAGMAKRLAALPMSFPIGFVSG